MKCSNCGEAKADYYCDNCYEPICRDCAWEGCECTKASATEIPKGITTRKELKRYNKRQEAHHGKTK